MKVATFTEEEIQLLSQCLNLGVAQLSQAIAQAGTAGLDEGIQKLAGLKMLAVKLQNAAEVEGKKEGE